VLRVQKLDCRYIGEGKYESFRKKHCMTSEKKKRAERKTTNLANKCSY
jgi:hypothetical protein